MSRRRKHKEHENHERWLVSYADFITLLFAFFVVLWASGQADQGRAKEMSESVRDAIEGDGKSVKETIAAMLGKVPPEQHPSLKKEKPKSTPPKPAELAAIMEKLLADLQNEIATGQMQVSLEPRGLLISLKQATFFPSGGDTVATETYASLAKLSAAIRPLPNAIRLEGHTDAIPIRNSRFQSNWELSSARSIAVLNVLSGQFQVPTNRMAVVGYAETVPIADNNSQDGRAHNRRVDIVLLNEKAHQAEPAHLGK